MLIAPLFTAALLFTGCDEYIDIFSDNETTDTLNKELRGKYINLGNSMNEAGYFGAAAFGTHKLLGSWTMSIAGEDDQNFEFTADGEIFLDDVFASDQGLNEDGTQLNFITVDGMLSYKIIENLDNNCYSTQVFQDKQEIDSDVIATFCKTSAIGASFEKIALSDEDQEQDRLLTLIKAENLIFNYKTSEETEITSTTLYIDSAFHLAENVKVIAGDVNSVVYDDLENPSIYETLACEIATFSEEYAYFCSVELAEDMYANYLFNFAFDNNQYGVKWINNGHYAQSTTIELGKKAVVNTPAIEFIPLTQE
jgi:hypothetical protein